MLARMKFLLSLLTLITLSALPAQAQCKNCGCKEKCTPQCKCQHDATPKAQ